MKLEQILKEVGDVVDFSKAKREKQYADIRKQNQQKIDSMGLLGDMPEALSEMAHFLKGIGYEIKREKPHQAQQIMQVSKIMDKMAEEIKRATRGE